MQRFVLVFLVLLMVVGANLSDGFLARVGIDPGILTAALVALVITGLVYHRRLALIVLVVIMTVAANTPGQFAMSIGYDPDFILAALLGLVFTPFIYSRIY